MEQVSRVSRDAGRSSHDLVGFSTRRFNERSFMRPRLDDRSSRGPSQRPVRASPLRRESSRLRATPRPGPCTARIDRLPHGRAGRRRPCGLGQRRQGWLSPARRPPEPRKDRQDRSTASRRLGRGHVRIPDGVEGLAGQASDVAVRHGLQLRNPRGCSPAAVSGTRARRS
jgi:hypothetical protein